MPKSHLRAGGVNLKGKKYKLLNCRCCECVDLRDKEIKKEHEKEIKEYSWQANSVEAADCYSAYARFETVARSQS